MENLEIMKLLLNTYSGKRVFVTGHTGFKGSWLCIILNHLGAEVTGYSLSPSKKKILVFDEEVDNIKNVFNNCIKQFY